MSYGENYVPINKEEFLERILKIQSARRKQKTVKEKNYVKKQLYFSILDEEYDNTSIILYAKKRFSREDYNDIMDFYAKIQLKMEERKEW